MEVCISTEMNAPSASHLGMVDCGFKTDQSTISPGKRLSSIPIQFHLPDLSGYRTLRIGIQEVRRRDFGRGSCSEMAFLFYARRIRIWNFDCPLRDKIMGRCFSLSGRCCSLSVWPRRSSRAGR